MNISTFFQLYRDSVAKFTFSVLNNKKNNFLAHSLTQNRNSRNLSQNKCGNSNDDILSDISKRSFLRKSIDIFNKLPRGLTLCPNKESFKKWLKRYHNMGEFDRFPFRRDNTYEVKHIISHNIILKCKFDEASGD